MQVTVETKYDILRPKTVWDKSLSCLSWPFVLLHWSRLLVMHHFCFAWAPVQSVCLCTRPDCLAWTLTDCLSFAFFSNSACITASLSVFLFGQPMSWDLLIMFPQPLFGYSDIRNANFFCMKWRRLLISGSRVGIFIVIWRPDHHHLATLTSSYLIYHHPHLMTGSSSSSDNDDPIIIIWQPWPLGLLAPLAPDF